MARCFVVIIVFVASVRCFGQSLETGVWLPQAYVEATMRDPFQNIKNLIEPVHCIVVEDSLVQIMTYASEMEKAVLSRSGDRFEVTNLKYMLNLNHYEASEFRTSAYFLSQRGDSLVLDIESDESKRAICFVSEFDGIRFESWRAFSLFKSIRGLYTLRDSRDTLSINLAGQIDGSKILRSLRLEFRAAGHSYIMKLKRIDEKETTIVIRYDRNSLSFYQFKQKREEEWYDIEVLEPPFMIFDRIHM